MIANLLCVLILASKGNFHCYFFTYSSFVKYFLECFTRKPVNLKNIFCEIKKKLSEEDIFPVTLCKTNELLPIILNDAANCFEKPIGRFFSIILVANVSCATLGNLRFLQQTTTTPENIRQKSPDI